ncbi:MAG: metallophosphoesterase [Gammaproteobacteria bacterium]|nr:metallophosphoesterase [Gammaproteobacteria bacterium]MDP6734344.1 metallophosphoesterase [Gammaproteobacteria bacterium]
MPTASAILKTRGYDLIGDIHGHADELMSLLEKMGYTNTDGCYRHPIRTAIFLGDLIDRGPKQKETLHTVMTMVKAGSALAVMGNHEFNALAYHTGDPAMPGTWLRKHNERNYEQHEAFLDEYSGAKNKKALEEVLAFFYSLQLWLDLDGVRVVHASWHPGHMEAIRKIRGDDANKLTPDMLVGACTEGSELYNAIEALLKGIEHPLPDGVIHYDKENTARTNVRVWAHHNEFKTLRDIIVMPIDLDDEILDIPVVEDFVPGYGETDKPVFLGHYWRRGHPVKLRDNVACLDYSVAKDGKLVAYRWSGETKLEDSNFFF